MIVTIPEDINVSIIVHDYSKYLHGADRHTDKTDRLWRSGIQ